MLGFLRTDGKLALIGSSAVNSKGQSEARWRGRDTCADPRNRPDGLCDSSRPAVVQQLRYSPETLVVVGEDRDMSILCHLRFRAL